MHPTTDDHHPPRTTAGFADSAALVQVNAAPMVVNFYAAAVRAGLARFGVPLHTQGQTMQLQSSKDCSPPWPCWCDERNVARYDFLALRQFSSAAATLPAAIIARLLGRKALLITGTCIFLIGACNSAAAPAELPALAFPLPLPPVVSSLLHLAPMHAAGCAHQWIHIA
jgi:hypothetical protein